MREEIKGATSSYVLARFRLYTGSVYWALRESLDGGATGLQGRLDLGLVSGIASFLCLPCCCLAAHSYVVLLFQSNVSRNRIAVSRRILKVQKNPNNIKQFKVFSPTKQSRKFMASSNKCSGKVYKFYRSTRYFRFHTHTKGTNLTTKIDNLKNDLE